jgi:ADP-heptose:LPS heptosyltransferase
MRQILGISATRIDPIQLCLSDTELNTAYEILHRLGIAGKCPIAFNIGSGERWKTKRWPMESFVELGLHLADHAGGFILLLGGPLEDETNRLLMLERPDRFVYPGVLPIRDFMALISLCRLLVTADTLALHVGLAARVPTVALFGPTSASEIEATSPLLKIIAPAECQCCYRKTCQQPTHCMENLSAQTVYTRIIESRFLSITVPPHSQTNPE